MKLALGTVQFGMPYGVATKNAGRVPFSEVEKMLQYAHQCNIDTIDTAISYGDSEQVLGSFGVSRFKVVSKLPAIPDHVKNVKNWIRTEVLSSIERLHLEGLYGLLLHNPIDLLGQNGSAVCEELLRLREDRLVQKIGISIYDPVQINELIGIFKPDLIQAPFNLVDRSLYDSGWMNKLKEAGVEIHVRSIFLQGLLLMKRGQIPLTFSKWNYLFNEWFQWLEKSGCSAIQTCINYPTSFPMIDRIVVGSNSLIQLQEIVAGVTDLPSPSSFPNISCNDSVLINPSKWQLCRV